MVEPSSRTLRASGEVPRVRRRRVRSAWLAVGVTGCLGLPVAAWGQGTGVLNTSSVTPDTFSTLVTPVLSPDYTRGHNVGVMEEGHPDYTAPGVPIGSFSLFPQLTVGAVADSNVFAADRDTKADVIGVVKPGFNLQSVWSRHLLQFQAYGDFRRYASQSLLNRGIWSANPLTELNFGKRFVLHIEGQAGRFYENPYSSDLGPQAQVLSNYLRTGGIIKGVYTGGRVRFTAAYDHSAYTFNTLRFEDGTTTDQAYRNREIDRFSGQAELAISPSLAVYVGTAADQTRYQVARDAADPRLSSTGQYVIAGVSFDLAGVMRGSIGAGYTHRSYIETAYRDVGAMSGQMRLDFFPYRTTTISVVGQRIIQDSGLSSTPYNDTRVSAQVDQSLRENLIVSLSAALASQSYIGTAGSRANRQYQTTVRYQASRWLGFQVEAAYRSARPSTAALGTSYNEVAMGLSATVRR